MGTGGVKHETGGSVLEAVNNLFLKFKLFRQLSCFYALKSFLRVQHSLKNIFQLCGLVQCAFGLQAWSFVFLLCVY